MRSEFAGAISVRTDCAILWATSLCSALLRFVPNPRYIYSENRTISYTIAYSVALCHETLLCSIANSRYTKVLCWRCLWPIDLLGRVWRTAQMAICGVKWPFGPDRPFGKNLRVWRENFANDKMAIWAADRPFRQLPISPID